LPLRAGDAELHRIRHRRPVRQQLDAAAHFREVVLEHVDDLVAQRGARLQILGQHHDLRHVGLRENLVQRQVEARRRCPHSWSR
jgi:hypothetical protein